MSIQSMLCSARVRCLVVTALFFWLLLTISAVEVWVITDQSHPVQGTPDRLIELDLPSTIEESLAAGLSTDPVQAATTVRHRLKEGGSELQQRLTSAYQDVVDAWSLGITTLPAVVVDQRYVIYGETDLERAVSQVQTYRMSQP